MAHEDKKVAKTEKGGNVAVYDDTLYETDVDVQDELDDLEDEDVGGPEDRLADGRNPRRILPPPKGTTWGPKNKASPFKKTWEHRLKLPGMKRPVIFNCPRRMRKEACPVCDKALALEASGNPVDMDAASELFPSRKYRCNWIDRTEGKQENGPRVGKFGIKVYAQIVDLHEEFGLSCLPSEKGYDVVIKRKGKERDTEYKVLKGDNCLLHDDPKVGNEWLADQYDLELFADCPDEDGLDDLMEQVEKFLGRRSRSGGGRDRGRSTGRSSSSRSKKEEDDDDEESGSSRRGSSRAKKEEDDDEDETPKRRRATRTAQADTEDDDK